VELRRQVGLLAQLVSIVLVDQLLSRIAQDLQVPSVLLDHHNRRVFCAVQATSAKAALQIKSLVRLKQVHIVQLGR